ncbi:hypothetical protein FOL47_001590 [Perkinsus chesapeaki]|uniref:Uncharacterized protein n=1 Tax=Perkinsus chesapeaki TaxID=330153 RepID=A0A7J6MII9_PERCH|nr:hypothetical protein FOL47_001590 [Perkinsus chesapeaki]
MGPAISRLDYSSEMENSKLMSNVIGVSPSKSTTFGVRPTFREADIISAAVQKYSEVSLALGNRALPTPHINFDEAAFMKYFKRVRSTGNYKASVEERELRGQRSPTRTAERPEVKSPCLVAPLPPISCSVSVATETASYEDVLLCTDRVDKATSPIRWATTGNSKTQDTYTKTPATTVTEHRSSEQKGTLKPARKAKAVTNETVERPSQGSIAAAPTVAVIGVDQTLTPVRSTSALESGNVRTPSPRSKGEITSDNKQDTPGNSRLVAEHEGTSLIDNQTPKSAQSSSPPAPLGEVQKLVVSVLEKYIKEQPNTNSGDLIQEKDEIIVERNPPAEPAAAESAGSADPLDGFDKCSNQRSKNAPSKRKLSSRKRSDASPPRGPWVSTSQNLAHADLAAQKRRASSRKETKDERQKRLGKAIIIDKKILCCKRARSLLRERAKKEALSQARKESYTALVKLESVARRREERQRSRVPSHVVQKRTSSQDGRVTRAKYTPAQGPREKDHTLLQRTSTADGSSDSPLPPTGLSLRLDDLSASLSRSAISTARTSVSSRERSRSRQWVLRSFNNEDPDDGGAATTRLWGNLASQDTPSTPHRLNNTDKEVIRSWPREYSDMIITDSPLEPESATGHDGYVRPPSRGAESWMPLGNTGWTTPTEEENGGGVDNSEITDIQQRLGAFRPPSRGGRFWQELGISPPQQDQSAEEQQNDIPEFGDADTPEPQAAAAAVCRYAKCQSDTPAEVGAVRDVANANETSPPLCSKVAPRNAVKLSQDTSGLNEFASTSSVEVIGCESITSIDVDISPSAAEPLLAHTANSESFSCIHCSYPDESRDGARSLQEGGDERNDTIQSVDSSLISLHRSLTPAINELISEFLAERE